MMGGEGVFGVGSIAKGTDWLALKKLDRGEVTTVQGQALNFASLET